MKKHLLLAVLMLLLSGCATVITGNMTHVKVTGTPENANVYYDGTLVGKSPCTITMSKKDLTQGKHITIVADGVKVNQTFLNRKINVGILAVDLVCGVIPAIVDLATGALYSPSPRTINYQLTKAGK
jgi:uncharacterized protein YceK